MEVKRILHVTDTMNKGGIETFIMNVYRNIDRSKIQFDFLISFPEKCDYEDEILRLGGKIYRTIPKRKGVLKYIKNTNKVLTKMPKYEVAHIHVSSLISALGWLLTKIRRIPVKMFHSHNTESKQDLKGKTKEIGQKILRKNSNYLFGCSKAAGIWMFGNDAFEKNEIITINNGIDIDNFFYNINIRNELRSNLNIDNKFVIGHIGRFNEQKNHEFIIDIFNQIYMKDKESILLLVGKGDKESKIYNKVRELGLEKYVLFLGLREDINSILNSMDIFLLPSFHEGLPVVGVEAQSTGIKCFMSDRVTKEVDITGLIDFISLDKPAEFWAKEILKCKKYNRNDTKQLILNNGFDINDVTKKLSYLYTQREG
ncbi:hypothetical protein ASG99_07700 [Bacillus sp. Soil768D1]|nr:hypothetical protein ASG99_07700 [Bacillus sp. Soil768D1]